MTGRATLVFGMALAVMLASGALSTCAASEPAAGGEGKGLRAARFSYWPLKPGRIVAADSQALWFEAGGVVWRYDVKSRSEQTFSVLDGLPPSSPDAVVLGPEGSFAMGYGGGEWTRGYVWRAGKGWTVMANIGWGGLCFDADGRLLRSQNNPVPENGRGDRETRMADLLRTEGDHWGQVGRVPLHSRLYTLARGYFFIDYSIVRDRAQYRFGYVPPDLSHWTPCDNQHSVWIEGNGHFLAGGKVYVVCRPPDYVRKRYLAELGESGLTVIGEVAGSGLDLRRGPILVLLKRREAQQTVYTIALPDGSALAEMPVPAGIHPSSLPLIFRDANGDVWLDDWRWDGSRWERVRPGDAPSVGEVWQAAEAWRVMENGLFSFELQPGPDGARLTLRKLFPHVPDDAECFDPVRQVGWIEKRDRDPSYFQFMRWPKDGAPEVIRSFPEIYRSLSRIQRTRDGDYWWVGRFESWTGDTFVWRFTAAGELRSYSCGNGADRSVGGRARPRMLCVSPAGKLWMWSVSGGFEYFDPQRGAFVKADPWEEFAFGFGKWRLSVLPVTGAQYDEEFDAPIGTIMVKCCGQWRPLIGPFGSRPLSAGRMSAFRGDRMIASPLGSGIVEYDATRDRWCLLTPHRGGPAGFDPTGRRIMGYQFTGLLALDGDPFELYEGVPDIQAEREVFYPLCDRIRGRDAEDAEAAMREMEQLPMATRKALWSSLDRACLDLEAEKSPFYRRVLALEMSVRPPYTTERPSALSAAHPRLTPIRLPPVKKATP